MLEVEGGDNHSVHKVSDQAYAERILIRLREQASDGADHIGIRPSDPIHRIEKRRHVFQGPYLNGDGERRRLVIAHGGMEHVVDFGE
jgi:hypothetical protein